LPPKGWKSITVRQFVYDYLKEEYDNNKKELLLKKGITTFSGYVSSRLAQLRGQDEVMAILKRKFPEILAKIEEELNR
jgi:hypothetical protein